MIELIQLKYIIALKKYGTLSRTAEKLYISQPSLTRAMQKLENDLQVSLFKRSRNRIEFNDNGEIIVEYAEKILKHMDEMVSAINREQNKNFISIGSCAPAPLWELIPSFTKFFPDMEISYDIIQNIDILIEGLENEKYEVIILPFIPENKYFIYFNYKREQLYLAVPRNHELSSKKGIYFSEIKDTKILRLSNIGFWQEITDSKMPEVQFMIQNDAVVFEELINTSELLFFSTNLASDRYRIPENRISIPILDREATLKYYFICKEKDKSRIGRVLEKIGL